MNSSTTRRWLSLLSASVALTPAVSASANDASFGFVGGTLEMREEADVSLVSEHLIFDWIEPETIPNTWHYGGELCPDEWTFDPAASNCTRGSGYWQANLTYVLRNEGDEAIELHVGLPFQFPDLDSDWIGPSIEEPIEDFVTQIDGENAAVTEVRGDEAGERFDRVYLVDVSFEPGQTRTLTHTYRTYGGADSSGGWWFDYILTTAQSWSGNVGSVQIDFELPFRGIPCTAVTLPHELDGSWVRVNLTDWAPERDFNVTSVRPWDSIYQVYNLVPWAVNAEEACAEVPEEERERARAAMELFYGAPQTRARLDAAGEASHFCSQNDMFAMARFHADDEPRYEYIREAWENAQWHENPEFPSTVPGTFAACFYQWGLE